MKECPYVVKSKPRGGYGVTILRCGLTKQPCVEPTEYEKCIYYLRKEKKKDA